MDSYVKKFYKKDLITKEFESLDAFFNDLIDYIMERINERNLFDNSEIEIIERYFDEYSSFISIFDRLEVVHDRLLQISNSCSKKDNSILKDFAKFFSSLLVTYGHDSNKSILERVELGNTLDILIFDNQDIGIFDVIQKSDKIFKYKYKDGESIVHKTLRYFKDSVKLGYDESSAFYARVVFEMLKKDFKINEIDEYIDDLRKFKSTVNDKEKCKMVLSLIDRLNLIKSEVITASEKDSYLKRFRHNYDIRRDFSNETETSKDLIYFRNKSVIDMRNKKIITMDNKFKTAYDDAISIEKTEYGYLLGIYITDVASFVDVGSMLYKQIKERGESLYGDDRNNIYIPMFPIDLTRNMFSLNQREDKYVVAYMFKFSDTFDFIDYEFNNAIINVNNNYSFEAVEHISPNDSNYDMIYILKCLTDELSKMFNSSYHICKEKSKKHRIDNSIGSNIISTSTVFLNSFIAEFFSKTNWPYIYRIHNHTNISDNIRSEDAKKIIKMCSTSGYSIVPNGHPVNNNKPYGHITNPIRSYASYINQYIFEYLMLDRNRIDDRIEFLRLWKDQLVYIVEELNKRLERNKEFLSVANELDSKRLVKK